MPVGTVNSTLPQYLGELFQTSKRPNTFLRLAGGIQGSIQVTNGIEFPIGVFYSLRAPSQPARLEGATAPAAEYRTMTQSTNVVQIFQESVDATYLGQSDKTMSGPVSIPIGSAQGTPQNPRSADWQVMMALETVAQDANYSFLRGTYAKPADPTGTALRTRGIVTAITTNITDESATAISGTDPGKQLRKMVDKALKKVIIANGYGIDDTYVLLGDVSAIGNVIAAYEELASNRVPESRDVAGMKIRTIVTRYGTLMVAVDPDMAASTLLIGNMGVVGVVGLEVPGKGILFEEALAKVGSTDKSQIYGQLGIDHGPEYCHGTLIIPAYDL